MGEAKRRREASGVQDERTSLDRKHALEMERWRIERQRNGEALKERQFGVIPHECRSKESK